jgi:hypothetical protein
MLEKCVIEHCLFKDPRAYNKNTKPGRTESEGYVIYMAFAMASK